MTDKPFQVTQALDVNNQSHAPDGMKSGNFSRDGSLPEKEGDVILDRFEVKRFLGQGAFGFVFLAYDRDLDRLVAIKNPREEVMSQFDDTEQFITEARTVAQLDHGNIVPVYDAVHTPEGSGYIISKYIQGQDLGWLMKKSKLSVPQVVRVVRDIALALHHAHLNGIVHCDIKPSNVILDENGIPHITDFGIAFNGRDQCCYNGSAATPAYMSPEQASAQTRSVDGRTDIYSLGVVLYELLCGRLPFAGETRSELLDNIRTTEARPLRQIDDSIPRVLETICLKAMSRDPARRYTTSLDLARDLEEYVGYDPTPIDVSTVTVPPALEALIESLAEHAHDIWAVQRYEDGWTLGDVRNDKQKTHPCLMSYDQLPESEKQYDRAMALGTIQAMLALGYAIEKKTPD